MFEIESGVPVPEGGAVTGSHKYPFNDMNVGDSFAIEDTAPDKIAKRLRAASFRFGRAHGKKFAIRIMSPNQVRIWRTV